MFAPNPWQLDMPVSMLTANSDSALISFVEREYRRRSRQPVLVELGL